VFISSSALVWNIELGCECDGLGVEDSEGAKSDVSYEKMLIEFGLGNFPGPDVLVAAAGLRGIGGCFSPS